jgi:hypothetical protein
LRGTKNILALFPDNHFPCAFEQTEGGGVNIQNFTGFGIDNGNAAFNKVPNRFKLFLHIKILRVFFLGIFHLQAFFSIILFYTKTGRVRYIPEAITSPTPIENDHCCNSQSNHQLLFQHLRKMGFPLAEKSGFIGPSSG